MSDRSKTQIAVALVDGGMSVRQAARQVDLSETAIRTAIKNREAKASGACPSCGGPVGADGKHKVVA